MPSLTSQIESHWALGLVSPCNVRQAAGRCNTLHHVMSGTVKEMFRAPRMAPDAPGDPVTTPRQRLLCPDRQGDRSPSSGRQRLQARYPAS